jgi:hypothetical protein
MPNKRSRLLLLNLLGGGGFSPLSIPGLALWLDASDASTLFQASDGTTPAVADNDVVGYWGDKSANRYTPTQATTADKPLVKTSIQNGRNVVRFDGSGDFLSYAGVVAAVSAFTAFYVIRPTGLVVNRRIAFAIGTELNGIAFSSSGDIAGRIGVLFSLVAWADTNTAYSSGQPHIITTERESGVTSVRLNGSSLTPTFNSVPIAATTITTIGKQVNANSSLSGDLCEMLIYSASLTAAQVAGVETYLNTKWGVY